MLDVAAIPRSPFDIEYLSDDLSRELEDTRSIEIAPEVYVGYKLLNRRLIGERAAVVAIGGFMSSLTAADRTYEGLQLAALDRPVLMLDMPGHGLSTPHNRIQVVDLCIKRDVTSQAEPLVDAVQNILDPEDPIDYFGISHGSLLGLKATELDPCDRVETVFGIDLPAVKKRITLGLQFGYLVVENLIGGKSFRQSIKDSGIKQDFEEFKRIHEAWSQVDSKSFIRNNPGLFMLNVISSINASPVGLWSWRGVLENKSAKVNVITSEYGRVSDPIVIQEFIDSLPEPYKARSKQIVAKGEDHNIGRAELMPRATQWARQAYAPSF